MTKRGKRNKGGRPRKNGERHACGKLVQPSQAVQERENKSVAIEARQRVFGLSAEQAAGEGGGSALGRMLDPRNPVNKNQFEAGKAFEQAFRDNLTAREFKRQRSASDYSGAGGHDNSDGTDPAYVAWCDRAIAKYAAMRDAVHGCGEPLAMKVLEIVILDDMEMWKWIGELRCGLNAIGRVDRGQQIAYSEIQAEKCA